MFAEALSRRGDVPLETLKRRSLFAGHQIGPADAFEFRMREGISAVVQ